MSGGDEEKAPNSDLWFGNLSARPALLLALTQELLLKDSECSGSSLFASCYKYLFIYILP